MANMIDYVRWRGDISFAASPFCEVDNIIFAMLSHIDLGRIVPESARTDSPITLAGCLKRVAAHDPDGQQFGAIIPRDTNTLLGAVGTSLRFRDTYVSAYRNEIDEDNVKQFSAVTFILPDNSLYVAFRGTDDTLVGWHEDLAMSYSYPTTSQKCAAQYLTDAAAAHSGPIRVGGHSKGGNLAIYASAFCPDAVRERIVAVYNNDGPGFMPDTLAGGGFSAIAERVYTVVPQSSIIGIMLEQPSPLHVIKSTESVGAFQHNAYTWEVMGTSFEHLPALSKAGKRHDDAIREWVGTSTPEERKKLTDTLFSVLSASGAKTLSDITEDKIKSAGAMIKAIAGLDKETRENVSSLIKRLAEAFRQ